MLERLNQQIDNITPKQRNKKMNNYFNENGCDDFLWPKATFIFKFHNGWIILLWFSIQKCKQISAVNCHYIFFCIIFFESKFHQMLTFFYFKNFARFFFVLLKLTVPTKFFFKNYINLMFSNRNRMQSHSIHNRMQSHKVQSFKMIQKWGGSLPVSLLIQMQS